MNAILPAQRSIQRVREKTLTTKEVRKLLREAKKRDFRVYLMFFLTANLGLRISETLDLAVEDFDDTQWIVRIRTRKQKGGVVVDHLDLLPRMMAVVRKYIKKYELNEVYRDGELITELFPFSKRRAQQLFDKYCAIAGIPKLPGRGIHSLRHYLGMKLAENEIDIGTMQDLLRHRSAGSTLVYIHSQRQREARIKVGLDE